MAIFGTSDETLQIVIRAKDEASKVIDDAKSKLEKLQASYGKMAKAGAVAFTALGVGIGFAVKQAADMQSLMMGLEAVTGSAEEASKQFVRLREVAKLPGLGLEEAIQGSINLQAAGFSAETAERSLRAFGNALATVGKGKAELSGVILALQQIASKGKISAEEINQLNERLPQIRKAMVAAFGTADTEALQKMGISAQQFVDGVVAEFEKLPPVTAGANIAFENLSDSIKILAVNVGTTFLPIVQKILESIAPVIEKIATWVSENPKLTMTILSLGLAFTGLVAVLGTFIVILPILNASFVILTTQSGALLAILSGLALPVLTIVAAIAALVVIGITLYKHWDVLKEGAVTAFLNIGETINSVIELIKLKFTGWGLSMQLMFQNIKTFWTEVKAIFSEGGNFLIGVAEGWANGWVMAVNTIIKALNSISVSVPEWVPKIGGKSWGINLPTVPEVSLPRFEHGGIVEGPLGKPVPIMAHGGERIIPSNRSESKNASGQYVFNIVFEAPQFSNRSDVDYAKEQFEKAVRGVVRDHKLSTI